MNNIKEISPGMRSVSERNTAVSIIALFDNANPGNFVMKKCSKCNKLKAISEFNRNSNFLDGYAYVCRKCIVEYQKKYQKTKEGIITIIHNSQRAASRKRGHRQPTYTIKELQKWCYSQPLFHELYDNWVKSKYDKWMKPSVDRIDDYKGYSLDNIQLMTWRENSNKGHKSRKEGKNNKASKSILQYTACGIFIKEYYSIIQAHRETKINRWNIVSVCNNNKKYAGGYIWKYKTDIS